MALITLINVINLIAAKKEQAGSTFEALSACSFF
jgi:hypothetical protein